MVHHRCVGFFFKLGLAARPAGSLMGSQVNPIRSSKRERLLPFPVKCYLGFGMYRLRVGSLTVLA